MLFDYLFVFSFLSALRCPVSACASSNYYQTEAEVEAEAGPETGLGLGSGSAPGLCFILGLSRAPTRGQHLLQFLESNTASMLSEVWQRLTHSASKLYRHMCVSHLWTLLKTNQIP